LKNCKIIIKAKKIPLIKNGLITYIEDKRFSSLHCEIFYKNDLIAKGFIFNFYKEFENRINPRGEEETKIKGHYDDLRKKFIDNKTSIGQLIYEIKYYKNFPISQRKKYINAILKFIKRMVDFYILEGNVDILSYVPSKSKIPDDLANLLSKEKGILLRRVIEKNSKIESKNLFKEKQTFDKYSLDFDFEGINKHKTFLVVDDVVGTGATFCEVMYKIYKFNNKINYFVALAKDVKR
jgi:adenine/guanine phosphoribosyltransferase-like PRPP-binding protein